MPAKAKPKSERAAEPKAAAKKEAGAKSAVSTRYDARAAEARWKKFWQERGIYKFDPSRGPIFSINTPPPYPTGEAHPGYALNWGYIDFIARYKRMRGYAVHFPQGWDVHGLPTESKVEKWKGKKSSEVPRIEWVKWCEEWTEKYIKLMKQDFTDLGFSIDWSLEYKTSMPEYIALVQRTFLRHLAKGLAYRGKHPVNWCTNCQTAIADAEIEYGKKRGKLVHLRFAIAGGKPDETITIATTRPELLAACVAMAVNPDDGRYQSLIGRRAIVPIFGQEVEILGSEAVDPQFGTGIMMICSFGDKQDVSDILKHKLPIIDAIDSKGIMTSVARKYQGLAVAEARECIIKDLAEAGIVEKQEPIDQNVGLCWRCKQPIEILNKEQWFLRAVQFKERIIHEANRCAWWPDYMKLRMINWAQSMSWDWVISRQKVYGTPFPIWYCDRCGEIIAASEEELPVDPVQKEKRCPKCKLKARPEHDTMDTWMDSSVTTYWHAGWPKSGWERFVPASLQPNGAEIIRTWNYYLMLRSLMLEGRPAFENLMINGWVTDETGEKMSKSLGNYTPLSEMLKRSYADAVRYWASRSVVGSDVPFTWKEVHHAEKFYTKLYNMVQFLQMGLEKIGMDEIKSLDELVEGRPDSIEVLDRWVLSKLQRLVESCTKALESYSFPTIDIEMFIWHEVADYYIEMVKWRIYEGKKAGQALWTLARVLETAIKLLAPFAPFITEEIYQNFFRRFSKEAESIHLCKWPEPDAAFVNEDAEKLAEIVKDIVAAVRQYKMTNKLPLNAPLRCATIEEPEIAPVMDDLKGALKIAEIKIGAADELRSERFKIGISVER
ncbi:MAG: valine--tRNA ligase [Candidatus Aenigmatarchaeota archaeon]